MPRKPIKEAPVIDVQVNEVALITGADAQNKLAELEQQAIENTTALAKKFGYTGSIDPDALQADAYAKGCATQQAFYQFGVSLLLLRERTVHGNWLQRLEQLNIGRRTAYNHITATMRVMNSDVPEALQRIGMSKILELQTLDEDEFKRLEAGDSVRGITLEAVESMSRRELQTKLKEAEEKLANTEARLSAEEKKHTATRGKLTALEIQTDKKIVALTDWPEALAPLSEQVAAAGRKLATALSELETCRIRAFEVGASIPEEDGPQRVTFEAALAHVAGVAADALNSAARSLSKEQLAFDNTLGNFLPE